MAEDEQLLDGGHVAHPHADLGEAGDAHGEDDAADQLHDGRREDGAHQGQHYLVPDLVHLLAVALRRLLYDEDPLAALQIGRVLPHGGDAALEQRVVLVDLRHRGRLQALVEAPEGLQAVHLRGGVLAVHPVLGGALRAAVVPEDPHVAQRMLAAEDGFGKASLETRTLAAAAAATSLSRGGRGRVVESGDGGDGGDRGDDGGGDAGGVGASTDSQIPFLSSLSFSLGSLLLSIGGHCLMHAHTRVKLLLRQDLRRQRRSVRFA